MERVLELEIWSAPGSCLSAEAGDEVAARAVEALDLPPTVILGLNFVPSPVDAELLQQALAEGELSARAFAAFCAAKGLEASPTEPHSAALFLEQAYGRALAWVHIPEGPGAVDITGRVHRWARSQGFCLQDPLALYCLCNIEGPSPLSVAGAT